MHTVPRPTPRQLLGYASGGFNALIAIGFLLTATAAERPSVAAVGQARCAGDCLAAVACSASPAASLAGPCATPATAADFLVAPREAGLAMLP